MRLPILVRTICLLLIAVYVAGTIALAVARVSDNLPYVRGSEFLLGAFCSQSVLLAAVAMFGPGTWLRRTPYVVAWLMMLFLAMASLGLFYSVQNFWPLAGLLQCSGSLIAPVILFALYRWQTGARWQILWVVADQSEGDARQFTLREVFVLVTAYAFVGLVARQSFAIRHHVPAAQTDITEMFLAAWICFFATLAAGPMLLFILRPTWKCMALFTCAAATWLAEPFLTHFMLATISPTTIGPPLSLYWSDVLQSWGYVITEYGSVVFLTLSLGLLSRGAGLKLVNPKLKPAEPVTVNNSPPVTTRETDTCP